MESVQVWIFAGRGAPPRGVALRAGEALRAGRDGEQNTIAIDDPAVSRRHLRITFDGERAALEDLGSTNHTFLNGRTVERAELRDGDVIRLGEAELRIEMAPSDGGPAAVDPAATPESSPYRLRDPDLALLDGCGGGEAALWAAARLTRASPLYAIADFPRAGAPPPPDVEADDALFPWLPRASALEHSPVLLSGPAPEALRALWGLDALVWLFGARERSTLCGHVRSFAGAFARPSLLEPQLESGQPAYLESLLEGCEALLFEKAGEGGERWTLAFRPGLAEAVTAVRAGLVERGQAEPP